MDTITAFSVERPAVEMTGPSRRGETMATGDQPSPRTSSPTQQGAGASADVGKLSWKYAIWGWLFLATEVVVMAALNQRGEGRTTRNIYIFGLCEIFGCDKDALSATSLLGEEVVSGDSSDEDQCTMGEGPPYLAEVLVLRAAIATLAQFFAFCGDGRLRIPHAATFALMFKLFQCCCTQGLGCSDSFDEDQGIRTDYKNRTTGRTERTEYGTSAGTCYLFGMIVFWVIPIAILSLYSWYPAYCGIQAVCELVTNTSVGLGFTICALVCACLGAASAGRNDDDPEDNNTLVGFQGIMLVVDSLLSGVFFVWGNFVQSGFAALAFLLVPAFNLVALLSQLVEGPAVVWSDDSDD